MNNNNDHSRNMNDSNVTNLQLLNSFAVGDDSSIDFEELRQRYKSKRKIPEFENIRKESSVEFQGIDLYDSTINPIDSQNFQRGTTNGSS